jgi:hypothetical protein
MKNSDHQDSGWKIYLVVSLVVCPVLLVGGVLGMIKVFQTGDWTYAISPIFYFTITAISLDKARRAYVNATTSANVKEEKKEDHQ